LSDNLLRRAQSLSLSATSSSMVTAEESDTSAPLAPGRFPVRWMRKDGWALAVSLLALPYAWVPASRAEDSWRRRRSCSRRRVTV
jgi:hypothetical protein